MRTVHNLAQICHTVAKGKVGSGFDVSAAVYGTHVYARFDPALIRALLDDIAPHLTLAEDSPQLSRMALPLRLAARLRTCVLGHNGSDSWDATVGPLHLPRGVELMMVDVCGGSESPSMARRVLAWRDQRRTRHRGDHRHDEWNTLRRINTN